MLTLPRFLGALGACREACRWAEGRLVDEEAYLACPRGDWLLWILARLGLPRPQLVLAACACARTALRYVPEGEERPLRAIETAEAWARGGPGAATLKQVRAATGDAYDTAADLPSGAATYAAVAAADAADAAHDVAAHVVDVAGFVADACAADDGCDGPDACYAKALAECADIVRSIVPWEVVEPLLT